MDPKEFKLITKQLFKAITVTELIKKEEKTPSWVVEKLLPETGIIAITGSPASFKTWLMLSIGLTIAGGNKLFEKFETQKSNVLLIDEENGERTLKERFISLGAKDEENFYIYSLSDFLLTSANLNKIIAFAQTHNIKVIFLDSLVRIHSADENSAIEMSKVFKMLKKLTKKGMTVIFTHHNRKQSNFQSNPSQSMRGSSDILASLDCHLSVERNKDTITITQTKLRQSREMKPFKLKIVEKNGFFSFEYIGEELEVKVNELNRKEQAKEVITEILKVIPSLSKTDLLIEIHNRNLDISRSTFSYAIEELIQAGSVVQQRGAGNTALCSLVSTIEKDVPE